MPDDDITITANFVACTYPDPVQNFTYQFLSDENQLNFTWDSINTSCIKGFELENIDSGEIYFIDAFREENNYGYSVFNIDPALISNYNFRIRSYNEYGVSVYTNLSFSLSISEFILNNVSVYPNPVNKKLMVKISDDSLPIKFQLFNILGEKMEYFYNELNVPVGYIVE